jgi:hypothetical protein
MVSKFPAHQIVLIRPVNFGFNPETAESNAFQHASEKNADPNAIQSKALKEFSAVADTLGRLGIDVLIFDDTPFPYTPDSIFPNNWFSTHPDGTLCLYPMMAENRRPERREEIITGLRQHFDVRRTLDLTRFEAEGKFLEGTGSLVLDHENKVAYACLSPRTDADLLKLWSKEMGFETVIFSAFDSAGQAIYHTNVLMCIGDKFVVICLDSIADTGERENLRSWLTKAGKQIVEISLGQMGSFAGNMLLLRGKTGENILAVSQQAFDSLDPDQISVLSEFAKLVAVDISTVETCGGGSVRCMIAENFLTAR